MHERLYRQFAEEAEDHWWFEGRRSVVEAVLDEALRTSPVAADGASRRILEVGCGTGAMLGMLSRFGDVSGLEMYHDAVTTAEALYDGRISVREGRIPQDVPDSADLDVVAAFDVLEHIEDDAGTLRRLRGALVPDGLLVLTVPAFQFLWGQTDVLSQHVRRYRFPALGALLEQERFRVERHTYFNSILFPPVAAIRVARRWFASPDREPGSDLDVLSSPLTNRVMTAVFSAERHVVRRHSFPVGVSLLVLARRVG